jgi:ketosteroid isomerase-like protein
MASASYIQFFLTDTTVAVYGDGDAAVVSCTENVLTGLDAQGGEPPGFAGGRAVATNVFVHADGGWRLVAHHASPVLAQDADADPSGGQATP